jgi:hypothetical protein
MALAKEWFRARELADLKLPGMPATAQGIAGFAKTAHWRNQADGLRKRSGRGGGIEYHYRLLGRRAREIIERRFCLPGVRPDGRIAYAAREFDYLLLDLSSDLDRKLIVEIALHRLALFENANGGPNAA